MSEPHRRLGRMASWPTINLLSAFYVPRIFDQRARPSFYAPYFRQCPVGQVWPSAQLPSLLVPRVSSGELPFFHSGTTQLASAQRADERR